jgi:hypothetical protein
MLRVQSVLYSCVGYAYDATRIRGGNTERVCCVAKAELGLGRDQNGLE